MRGSETVVDPILRDRVDQLTRGKLCTRRYGTPHKTRVFTIVPGFSPNHNIGVYNNCVDTVERAFVERYFLCKVGSRFEPALQSSDGQYSTKHMRRFRQVCLSHLPRLPRLTYQECLDLFPAKKRKVYEDAYNSFASVGPVTKRDSTLSSFVKFEKQDVGKAPRVINPRSPRFNLEVATYLKHLEHHIFKAINKSFGGRTKATVIKGFDADVAGEILSAKWHQFKRPVAVGLDATKFDMHVTPSALRYEHSFYTKYWGSSRLAELLSWQLTNKGCAKCDDGRVEFSMNGTRCSGDINTSLGNCIIMCSLIYAFAKEKGIDVELANNGDDCVVFLEEADLEKFQEDLDSWFQTKGFRMTVEEPVFELEQVEFCQTHPVCVDGAYRMIRNPLTCLRKDVMCLRPIMNDMTFRKWLYAVGAGGVELNSGVPVLQSFYNCLKGNGVKSEKFNDLVSPYRFGATGGGSYKPVSDGTRVSFHQAFRILPEEQVLCEKFVCCRVGNIAWDLIDREDLDIELPGTQILDL